jgi:4-carboxymuconolactone decarboxylase
MSEVRDKGLALYGEIYGQDEAESMAMYIASGDGFGVKQAEWTLDWSFGQVWASTRLERKMRSCAVLGMLIGLRAADEIKYHTRMGIANGLTRQELEEIFYTAIPYAGFPAANVAKAAMLEVFAEIDAKDQA